MKRALSHFSLSILAVAHASVAHAEEASVSASVSPGAVSGNAASKRPTKSYFELGLFGGALFPATQHNFQNETYPHQSFKSIAPEIGARLAFYPFEFAGAEVEGMAAPAKDKDGGAAGLWALRAHALAQLPLGSITPFVLVGVGRMGAGSNAMGSDSDPSIHFGGGAKLALDDFIGLRLDLRDNLAQKNQSSEGTLAHNPEILVGLSFTLDPRKKATPPPPDSDSDGIIDPDDACPKEPGVTTKDPKTNGCPPPPDQDADGIVDASDACPTEAGVVSEDAAKNGCPAAKDSDGDGVLDGDDKCPEQAGVAPDGCPDLDPDKDGVVAPDDKCPDVAETVNGFEDEDGCPDEVPQAVQKFSGVIGGIEFDLGKATIRAKSKPVLDEAVTVLKDYPTLRIEVSGHTDNQGDRDKNVLLSEKRAEAVRQYLVSQGIDAGRIATRGAGPDAPIADNKSPAGQQKNRRIEFKLLSK